jgi:hypothetical protein
MYFFIRYICTVKHITRILIATLFTVLHGLHFFMYAYFTAQYAFLV